MDEGRADTLSLAALHFCCHVSACFWGSVKCKAVLVAQLARLMMVTLQCPGQVALSQRYPSFPEGVNLILSTWQRN